VIVVAAVIEANEQFLVTRRQAGVHLAGMWEFQAARSIMMNRTRRRFAGNSGKNST